MEARLVRMIGSEEYVAQAGRVLTVPKDRILVDHAVMRQLTREVGVDLARISQAFAGFQEARGITVSEGAEDSRLLVQLFYDGQSPLSQRGNNHENPYYRINDLLAAYPIRKHVPLTIHTRALEGKTWEEYLTALKNPTKTPNNNRRLGRATNLAGRSRPGLVISFEV